MIPPTAKAMRYSKELNFAWFYNKAGVMYTTNFVKIPAGVLQFVRKLVELTGTEPL